jgi:acyl-CoA thioester hydrolase
MEASGVVLPVIEADCRYRRPARYDEEMEIRTRARILSPVRMEFRYEVTVKGESGVVASGRTVHAAIGRDGRPCRLPAQVAQALA